MNYSKEHAAYLRAIRTHGWTVGLCRVLVLVLLLGLWELGARLDWFDVFILSSPSRVLSAIGRLWGEGSEREAYDKIDYYKKLDNLE